MASSGSSTQLGGPMAWWVWALAVTFVVFLFSFQTGYAIVNSSVQKDLSLTVAQVGTIAALYTWAFAICQFFGGALLDRLGSHKILPISIALVTLGIFIFANAKSFEMLLLSQVVIAVGSCTGFVGAGYVGGKWFGMAKFSFMFGLVQVVAALTSAFSQNLIGLALGSMTWRTLFNLTAVFGLVLLVLGYLYIKDPKPVVSDHKAGIGEFFASVVAGMMEVAKIGHVWIASLAGALTFGAMLALGVVWMPKLLMAHGLSETTANFGASLLWLGLAAGSAVIPHWSDVIRKRKMPIVLGNAVQLAGSAGPCLHFWPRRDRGTDPVLHLRIRQRLAHARIQHGGGRGEATPDRHVGRHRERHHVHCRRHFDLSAGHPDRLGTGGRNRAQVAGARAIRGAADHGGACSRPRHLDCDERDLSEIR